MRFFSRVLLGTLVPAASLALVPVAAHAAPTQTTTAFSADAAASRLSVDANLTTESLLIPALTPATVQVDSAGSPQVTARGANLDGSAVLGAVPLDGILSEVTQTAPPDNADPATAELAGIPAEPVLTANVSTATVHARDPLAVCGTDDPIGRSYIETAGATVVSAAGITLLTVSDPNTGGPTYTLGETSFVPVAGQTGYGIQSDSETQIDRVTVLAGTPAEFSIEVSDIASLVATATGAPGGATATYAAPVINITSPEGSLIPEVPLANETPRDQFVGTLDQITQVVEDVIDQTLGSSGVADVNILFGDELLTVDAAPDGTSVVASTAVLRIEIVVLDAVSGGGILNAVIELGRMSSSATVPAGGVVCGLPFQDDPLRELHKDASQGQVAPGGQFDYTLTIPNRGSCTLTDVVVTDVISGPVASVTASPAATSTDGNTLTWNLGELAPNQTATIDVTITVPADAAAGTKYLDTLTARGVCDGEPIEKTVTLGHPTISGEFGGGCNLTLSNKRATHLEVTPGQTFNYLIHVFNRGDQACGNVSVTDTLDDRLSFVSCTDGCANTGQDVTWGGRTVPGGSGMTLAVTVAVRDGSTGELQNTADISTPDGPSPVTVTWSGPTITDRSVLAPSDPPMLVARALPRTGTEVPTTTVLGLGLAGLTTLALRRRMLL